MELNPTYWVNVDAEVEIIHSGDCDLVQEYTINIVVSSLMTAQSQIGNRFTVFLRNGHSLRALFCSLVTA